MEVLSRVLAGVVRRFLPRYRLKHKLSIEQRKAARAIVRCKTPALGGHLYHCDSCGKSTVLYHGCRNRHCPGCQAIKTKEWLEKQKSKLLPVDYYHAVFTVASELRLLFAYNRRLLYGRLFSTSSGILQSYAADPKWLGGKLGLIGVLHTWGQQLALHPHIHFMVTAGGVDANGNWIRPRMSRGFLFPVVEMSAAFKETFLKSIRRLHRQNELIVPPGMDLEECLKRADEKKWEVFLQPPMKGPEKLLKYLGAYTHKVAISPSRIVKVDATHVSFKYRDYRQGKVQKIMKLLGEEFLGRFLQHVLPQRFRRIRHYGIFAGGQQKRLTKIRETLIQSQMVQVMVLALMAEATREGDSEPWQGPPCPDCEHPLTMGAKIRPEWMDTS